MGNQIVVHRLDIETPEQKKTTTDISLQSIVAKEQAEIDSIKTSATLQTNVINDTINLANRLSTVVENLHYVADSLYKVIGNIYINKKPTSKAKWFIEVEEKAYDHMRQYPEYFEVD